MSSYLTFYLQPAQKKAEKLSEPMALMAYTRSSEVYQAFYEELVITNASNKKHPYTEITIGDMHFLIRQRKEEIARIKQQITSMRKIASTITNPIVAGERLDRAEELETYVKELMTTFRDLKHIEYLVESIENDKDWGAFSKVLANIS